MTTLKQIAITMIVKPIATMATVTTMETGDNDESDDIGAIEFELRFIKAYRNFKVTS